MTAPMWLTAPDDLTGHAAGYWKSLAPRLWRAGRLTIDSAEPLKALCRLLAISRTAADEIGRDGVTIATGTGSRRAHPAVEIMLKAQRDAEPLLREIEMSQ